MKQNLGRLILSAFWWYILYTNISFDKQIYLATLWPECFTTSKNGKRLCTTKHNQSEKHRWRSGWSRIPNAIWIMSSWLITIWIIYIHSVVLFWFEIQFAGFCLRVTPRAEFQFRWNGAHSHKFIRIPWPSKFTLMAFNRAFWRTKRTGTTTTNDNNFAFKPLGYGFISQKLLEFSLYIL